MKKLISFLLLLTVALTAINCGDDDEKEMKLSGSWEVTAASGVEWEKGVGVINTNESDDQFIGEIFEFTSTEATLGSIGTFDYTFSNGVITIDLGGGDTEEFIVVFDGSSDMEWTQEEPTEDDDYEYKESSDKYLYYQKSLTLEKQ